MTADKDSKILKKLAKQEKEEGKLPLLLEFYRKLLQIQSGARKRIGTPRLGISREAIRKRIQKGLPLLEFDNLTPDWELMQDVFAKVAVAFAKYPQLFGDIHEKLKKPGAGRLLTKKAAKAWFTGKELPATMKSDISDNLMRAIIQATFQPFLTSHAQALISFAEQESWRRGYCPICGGSPDLAFLEKEYGARWLVCSRCDSEWPFQRLECPYCGTQDQNSLAYFTDDEGLYRLYVCERCKRYLKATDLRKAGEEEILLPLERLITLDMDRQAQNQGYLPCGGPLVH